MPDWWSRGPTSWRPRARSRRPGAPTSRRWTSLRPSRSCSGATRASSRAGTSRSSKSRSTVARQRSWPPPRQKRAPRCIVNPMMRPAGVLIPEGAGRRSLQAGFGQTEAQVMKVGMAAEATCVSKPWAVIPMVVTGVQDFIAAGQFRGGEQLIDAQQVARPGTILVFLEPLYHGGLDGVIPGSSCIVNAYSSNHELLASSPDMSTTKRLVLHGVDAVGLVHALLLRIQALVLPIQSLVFSGH